MATQTRTIVDRTPLIGRNFEAKSNRPLIIGIDPGLSGALAVVDLDSMKLVDMIDIPVFKKDSKARKQGYMEHLDVHKLSQIVDIYAPMTSLCVLEEPGAMPKQGLSSTFRFGHVCGAIHGVMAGHYMTVIPIKPSVWKPSLGLSSNKDDSRREASVAFRGFSWLWELKKHNDRAEAALLAIYGARYLKGLIDFNRAT